MNKAFEDNNSFSSSQAMADAIEKVYGKAKDGKNIFNLYRKIYPMVSSEESGFVSVSLVGFGQRLVDDQTMTTQRQVWSFTDTSGSRHDYTINIRYNQKELNELTAEDGSEVKSVITKEDTYLDKSADFETAWNGTGTTRNRYSALPSNAKSGNGQQSDRIQSVGKKASM